MTYDRDKLSRRSTSTNMIITQMYTLIPIIQATNWNQMWEKTSFQGVKQTDKTLRLIRGFFNVESFLLILGILRIKLEHLHLRSMSTNTKIIWSTKVASKSIKSSSQTSTINTPYGVGPFIWSHWDRNYVTLNYGNINYVKLNYVKLN